MNVGRPGEEPVREGQEEGARFCPVPSSGLLSLSLMWFFLSEGREKLGPDRIWGKGNVGVVTAVRCPTQSQPRKAPVAFSEDTSCPASNLSGSSNMSS